MYVCICRAITEADVRRAGCAGPLQPDRLVAVLGLDGSDCCGRCADEIEFFVGLARQGALGEAPEPAAPAPSLAVA